MTKVSAYIGLGSNLKNPIDQIKRAFDELNQLSESSLLTVSRLYRSSPMGPQYQPDYINAVAEIETALSPHVLLEKLLEIECQHGRIRTDGKRWTARTLDLDLLLYGDYVIQEKHLTVPHPGMLERAFVVTPLLEISPDLILPNGRHLKDYSLTTDHPCGCMHGLE